MWLAFGGVGDSPHTNTVYTTIIEACSPLLVIQLFLIALKQQINYEI